MGQIISVNYEDVGGGAITPTEIFATGNRLDGRTEQLEVGKTYVLTFTSSTTTMSITNAEILYSNNVSTTWGSTVYCHCVIFKATSASVTFNTSSAFTAILCQLD